MEILALSLSVLAALLGWLAWTRAGALGQRLSEIELQARRRVENLGEDTEQQLTTLRRLLAMSLDGGKPSADMVLEGRLWGEADGARARELVATNARVVDVRTPSEVATGKIPGALCIPIDELEERCAELEPDARPTLVYCAGGGRSAAACEFLSRKGHLALFNLEGGIGAWPGELQRDE